MVFEPHKVQRNNQGEPWCPDCGRVFTDMTATEEVKRDLSRLGQGVAAVPSAYCETCGAAPKPPPPIARAKKRGA